MKAFVAHRAYSIAMETRWHSFPDRVALEGEAMFRIERTALEALGARERFTIVLAGGDTPRGVYARLRGIETQWSNWRMYFGDERCLPVGDPQRNDAMAAETLLRHVPIAPECVHSIPAELGPVDGARIYSRQLSDVEDFDLVLLGLGEDGHTASLFPGHDWGEAPGAADALAVVDAPKPPRERVSLSAARLARARTVLFLVSGASKRDAVVRWRNGERIPAAAVQCPGGVDVLMDFALYGPGESG